jgi:transcriptional regulator with XRE-family HTH domain
MSAMANPVVSKILLGFEMRELRENSSVSREAMAEVLDCDLSKISRIENGKGSLTSLEVKALAELFDLPTRKAEQLKALAKDSRRRASYRVADWAQKYAGMEQASSEIRTYQNELVHGLLQTADYARAVTLAADPTRSAREVDRLVAGRSERQNLLVEDRPPRLVDHDHAVGAVAGTRGPADHRAACAALCRGSACGDGQPVHDPPVATAIRGSHRLRGKPVRLGLFRSGDAGGRV